MRQRQMALLFDMTRCGGCSQCVAACMEGHGFPGDPEQVTQLSATSYTHLATKDDFTYRNLCRHCVEPSCVSVCPVAALQKAPEGPVFYDADKCMGCRYCMTACPFNIPRYEWDEPVPAVRKCDMCIDRIRGGEIPRCAAACRQEATVFGPRDDLLAEAHARIAEDPDEYHDHVYGELEVGGTSVLFLTPFPLEELGFAESLGTDPLPRLTWNVLEKIPGIAVTGCAALFALRWIIGRRDEVPAWERARRLETAAAEAAEEVQP